MADRALLLVDAQEGPMPLTFFVVEKALAARLPILVVINKIDKPAARPDWAVDQVFDLLARLDAPLDFPVVYASAKEGYALMEPEDEVTASNGMEPVSKMIVRHVPPPSGDGFKDSQQWSPGLQGPIHNRYLRNGADELCVLRIGAFCRQHPEPYKQGDGGQTGLHHNSLCPVQSPGTGQTLCQAGS